ncbi:MAG TPA: hypothetical protein VE223_00510 [Nitrososphaeraceae archaeon]|nr:hypothetical protein [Nitrososphaeraceae archaeon]
MITPQDADELRQILEEKNKAIDVNDVLALFAIGGLLLILAGFVLGNNR